MADNSTTFSDGTTVTFDPGTAPEMQQAALDAIGAKRATAANAPVTAGDQIYSATRRYPNNWFGQSAAWADHNLGGNWLNRAVADPLNTATGDAGPTALRVGMQAETAPADLAARVYNVGKGYLAPNAPSAPILSESLLKGVGSSPELPANAPYWRQLAEGTASGILGGPGTAIENLIGRGTGSVAGNIARNVGGSTASTAAGMEGADIGGRIGGEGGALVGGVLAGGGAGLAGRGIVRAAAPALAHPNAQAIYDAAQESDIPLSFRTLANPTGQRIAASAGAVPIFGGPIEAANERTRQGVQNVRDAQANVIAGPGGIPPAGATRESIGGDVVQAAQDAVTQAKQRENNAWQPVNTAMGSQTVDVAPVVSRTEQMLEGNRTVPAVENAVRGQVSDLASMAPGGTNYSPARGPVPPLPQPTMEVPWSATKDFQTGLTQQLGRGDISVPGNITANVKNFTLDAMRDAATRAGVNPAQFDTARNVSAAVQPILDKLYPISGQPVAGQFRSPMGEGQAYGWLTRNLNSPSNLGPVVDVNSPAWKRAAGGLVSTLGDRGPGNFRPEKFAEDMSKIGPVVQTQLAQTPVGGLAQAYQHLQNAATVGSNFVTPTSRFGLTSSLGTGYVVSEALRHLGEIGHAVAGPVGRYALPAAVLLGGTRALESPGMHAAMAGRSAGLANDVFSTLPRLAAVTRYGQPQ